MLDIKSIKEGAAAAAVLARKLPGIDQSKRVGVVLSGGNIDPDMLRMILGLE